MLLLQVRYAPRVDPKPPLQKWPTRDKIGTDAFTMEDAGGERRTFDVIGGTETRLSLLATPRQDDVLVPSLYDIIAFA